MDLNPGFDNNLHTMEDNPYKPPAMSGEPLEDDATSKKVDPFIASFLTLTACVASMIMVFGRMRLPLVWGLPAVGAMMVVFETIRPNRRRS